MNEKKQTIIKHVGMWTAAVVGSIVGIGIIIGYIMGWGPGGSMIGPIWRIFLVGIPSLLLGAYFAELYVRKLAPKLITIESSILQNVLMAFVLILSGSMLGFMVGWEIGFILGKATNAIEGLGWTEVLLYAPIMSIFYGIIPCLIAATLFSGFVFILLTATKTDTG